jgi:hypothetical protein
MAKPSPLAGLPKQFISQPINLASAAKWTVTKKNNYLQDLQNNCKSCKVCKDL